MRTNLGISLVAVLALSYCASQQPLIISGEGMVQLADQFVATAEVMDQLLDSKVITYEQYQQWAKFGKRFQALYPLAVEMWQLARANNDPDLASNMVNLVDQLAVELLFFKAEILKWNK